MAKFPCSETANYFFFALCYYYYLFLLLLFIFFNNFYGYENFLSFLYLFCFFFVFSHFLGPTFVAFNIFSFILFFLYLKQLASVYFKIKKKYLKTQAGSPHHNLSNIFFKNLKNYHHDLEARMLSSF